MRVSGSNLDIQSVNEEYSTSANNSKSCKIKKKKL